VAAFAYILLLRHEWPGHPVVAVVAVYFAALSLLIGGWRRHASFNAKKTGPMSTYDRTGR
jgi:hypothetical protein